MNDEGDGFVPGSMDDGFSRAQLNGRVEMLVRDLDRNRKRSEPSARQARAKNMNLKASGSHSRFEMLRPAKSNTAQHFQI